MTRRIRYAALSWQGRRKSNQDNLCCLQQYLPEVHGNTDKVISGEVNSKSSVLAVFDGMGGEAKGETASYLAAKRCSETILKPQGFWFLRDELKKEQIETFCRDMNQDVVDYANENRISTMGSTVAGICFSRKKLFVFNVGDSRVYSIKDNKIRQISVDHVEEESIFYSAGLTQYLGVDPKEMLIEPEVKELAYDEGETFLICSDGLSHFLTDDEIFHIVNTNNDLNKMTEQLVSAAYDSNSNDNITVIACRAE